MEATLRSRQLRTLSVGEAMRLRSTPFVRGLGLQGKQESIHGKLRRGRQPFCPQAASKSKRRGKAVAGTTFSLRDEDTKGNIGLLAVLGTAVVVGGALVIFNPYAGQKIRQETIEVVTAPAPLPISSTSPPAETKPAPPVATKPPPPPPPKPQVQVQPPKPSSIASSAVPVAPPMPAVKPKPMPKSSQPKPTPTSKSKFKSASTLTSKPSLGAASKSDKTAKGSSNTSLIGGLVLVATVGGAVAYFAGNTESDEGETKVEPKEEPKNVDSLAPTEPETPIVDSLAPTEPESTNEVPEATECEALDNVQDAREWIRNWREKQE